MNNTQFSLESFATRRQNIVNILDEIEQVAKKFQLKSIIEEINHTKTDLLEEKFKLVVLGEFSRGKSTFINALMGTKVLPSSTNPTTAFLNIINYNINPYFRLYFKKGQNPKDLSQTEFLKLVAPIEPIPGDEDSIKTYEERQKFYQNIRLAEIGYPIHFCAEGVQIVDTPGTNDLDTLREQITYEFIPNSDAVIFMLAANQPLSNSEMKLLQERILANDVQRIFFVINFKDKLATPSDCEKSFNHIRKNLEQVVAEPRMFMVSSKNALAYRRNVRGELSSPASIDFAQTGIEKLESSIAEFLTNERGWIKLQKPAARGIRLAKELDKMVNTYLASLGLAVEELSQKIHRLQPEIEKACGERDRVIMELKSALESRRIELRSQLQRGLEDVARVAVSTVTNYTGNLSENAISSAVESAVAPRQTTLHQRIQEAQEEMLSEEIGRAARRLDDAWNKLNLTVDRELKTLTTDNRIDNTALAVLNDVDFSHETGFGSAIIQFLSEVFFFIPNCEEIFQRLFSFFGGGINRERYLGQVRAQIDARYYNIIPGVMGKFDKHWEQMVQSVTKKISEDMSRRIKDLQDSLQCILKEREQAQADDERRKTQLTQLQSTLVDSINNLNQYVKN